MLKRNNLNLTKEEEVEIAWHWHNNPSLALVYKTFENYVRVVTNSPKDTAGENNGSKCY